MPRLSNRFRKSLVGISLALGILALAAVVFKGRQRRVVTIDGTSQWNYEVAPPRRQIVWQNANPIEIDLDGFGRGVELARPEFYITNGGDGDIQLLYVTVRLATDQFDIYRLRLVDGVWSGAEDNEKKSICWDLP